MKGSGIEFAERPLRGGLRAVAVRNPGVETVALGVHLHISSIDEGKDEHGLAYMTGACLEEGTAKRSAIALAEHVEILGAALGTSETGARIQCPAHNAEAACAVLREVVGEPGFRQKDVDRVKREILAEIQADLEEPSTVAAQRFRREVYGAHPYARPAYGSAEETRRYDAEDVRRFWRTRFAAPRGFVVGAGPFEVERTLDLLQAEFGTFAGRGHEPKRPDAPPLPDATRRVHVPMEREQVHVFLGHPGIKRTDPDFHALLVMDNVLGSGSGFTARIPKRLRDELGLCYSVGASIADSAGEEPGSFRAYIGTSAENVDLAIEGFLEEIRKIRLTPPDDDELRMAQDYLAGSFVLGLERNASLAAFAVRVLRFGLGFEYLTQFPRAVRAVTAADVCRVAERHLHPDRVVVVSAGASGGEAASKKTPHAAASRAR